jgi:hypothetical protein
MLFLRIFHAFIDMDQIDPWQKKEFWRVFQQVRVLYIFSDVKEARKSFQLNFVTINYKKIKKYLQKN